LRAFAPYLWITIGAILGANLRYVLTRGMATWLGTGFPYGTFVANIGGSFAMGLVATLVAGRLVAHPEVMRLTIMVGFLGSLTTFSSLMFESNSLFNDGEWMRAALNIVLSIVAGLVGLRLGVALAPQLRGLS
jgi:fluoride exporter